MKIILTLVLLMAGTAQANFRLANNGKTVVCYADDNQSWILNKSRTAIKYTVEGESSGPYKIFRKTKGKAYISYATDEGTLTLGFNKDTYQFAEADDSFEIECK
ncbi:MAG: hypothetical protein AABY53_09640 [Bdellovibrionota bacterium]